MGKIIAVSSGKGGTGKTTAVAAISACLAALGYKTLCVDFDFVMKNLDLSLCMSEFAVADYMDVVNGQLALLEACNENPLIPNLFFLAAPTVYNPVELNPAAIVSLLDEVKNEFDYCLVDLPAGIGDGFRIINSQADMSIIVTTGELPAMRDAQLAAGAVREIGINDIRLLLNRVSLKNFKWLRATIDDIIDMVGARLIGVVPEDKSVFRAVHDNTPLVLYKKRHSIYEFLDIARRIAGEDMPLRIRR